MIKIPEQIKIEDLSKKRYEYLKEYEESWEEEAGHYTVKYNSKIDELGEKILEIIKIWRTILPFEYIIEELTKLGQAPCLLYDDDGRFAISGEGANEVVCGDEPIDMSLCHFIKKDMWKNSIREALNYYLDNE